MEPADIFWIRQWGEDTEKKGTPQEEPFIFNDGSNFVGKIKFRTGKQWIKVSRIVDISQRPQHGLKPSSSFVSGGPSEDVCESSCSQAHTQTLVFCLSRKRRFTQVTKESPWISVGHFCLGTVLENDLSSRGHSVALICFLYPKDSHYPCSSLCKDTLGRIKSRVGPFESPSRSFCLFVMEASRCTAWAEATELLVLRTWKRSVGGSGFTCTK